MPARSLVVACHMMARCLDTDTDTGMGMDANVKVYEFVLVEPP